MSAPASGLIADIGATNTRLALAEQGAIEAYLMAIPSYVITYAEPALLGAAKLVEQL